MKYSDTPTTMKKHSVFSLIMLVIIGFASCQQTDSNALKSALLKIDSLNAKLESSYVPGWGEVMRNSVQIHHSNLWFAGQEKNWDLAEHMVEELEESFQKLRTWKENDPRTTALAMIDQPLKDLAQTIEEKDTDKFKKGFLTLTNSCNNCHIATDNAIYVIQIPTRPAYTNQKFTKP